MGGCTVTRRRAATRLIPVVLVSVLVLAACDWVQPGADAGQSGFQPNESTLTAANVSGIHQLFAVAVGSAPDGALPTPIKAGGGEFVTSCPLSGCVVSRRDAVTGALVWSAALPSAQALDPVVSGTSAIVASGNQLIAYDGATGARRWSSTRPEPIRRLAVSENFLVTSEAEGADVTYASSVEVVSAADGSLAWAKDQGVWPGGFTIGNGVVYANRMGLGLQLQGVDAYDLSTGTLLRTLAPNCAAARLANSRIFQYGRACDTASGAIVWSDPALDWDAAIDPTSVFSSTSDANGRPVVQQFDAATGRRGWSHGLPLLGGNTPPTIANGVVYAGAYSYPTGTFSTYARSVTAFRESDGTQLFSVTLPGSGGLQGSPSVIVAQGRIYFLTAGILYAYGL